VAGLIAIAALAAGLRFVYPAADPPWRTTVGIVWHDEGAWVHNARNRALFGEWRLDAWNPMYVSPVFTALEYASFRAFGVGLRQARVVSQLAGLASVILLGLAVARAGGRRAGLFAAGLLATNYVYVMWNRAALLETTMTAFLVAALYGYTRAVSQPAWGLLAGLCAWMAFFSKAAAAFFLPALALVAAWPLIAQGTRPAEGLRAAWQSPASRAGCWTLVGLAAGGVLALVLFVGPNWQEYWFYNWQMSVTRKPSYAPKALLDRLSWFPILHDAFTRMWLVLVVSVCATCGALLRWRRLGPADGLLLAWVVFGVAELLLHDVGNERRLIFLVPAMCGLTALALARDGRLLPAETGRIARGPALLALPVALYALYIVFGPIGRLPFLYEVRPAVWTSAALAAAAGIGVYAWWPRFARLASEATVGGAGAAIVVMLVMLGDLAQFTQWAAGRTYRNYEALLAVADRIPAGTVVHGKLANGLSLESAIRPIFVGRGFGNFDDRLHRDDAEYLLTYISPEVGYEGDVILDVLRASPGRRVLWTVPVAESTCDCDAAALVAKRATPLNAALPVLSLEESP
jgi:4-amino-4-deoxy-L-arabinose transferase-like glycosyltransferase